MAQSAANSNFTNMELYEKKTEKVENDPSKAFAMAFGALLGLAAISALETTIIWAILIGLVGTTFTWVQVFGVFGVLLIVNGLTAKFKS